jgi:hypothetical protein
MSVPKRFKKPSQKKVIKKNFKNYIKSNQLVKLSIYSNYLNSKNVTKKNII